MGFAISLRSDHPSARAVRSLWNRVERFEARPSMASLGYPPHITFAIYDDAAIGEPEVRSALKQAGRKLGVVPLTFDAIRFFETSPMVLWAAPQPSPALQAIHHAIHSSIDPLRCRPYYRPGAWTPHCTLGTSVRDDRREEARSFARGFQDSLTVYFDSLELMSFSPLTSVDRLKLL